MEIDLNETATGHDRMINDRLTVPRCESAAGGTGAGVGPSQGRGYQRRRKLSTAGKVRLFLFVHSAQWMAERLLFLLFEKI